MLRIAIFALKNMFLGKNIFFKVIEIFVKICEKYSYLIFFKYFVLCISTGLAQIALLKLKRPISAAAPTELTVPGAGGGGGKIKISSQPATCFGVFALESLESADLGLMIYRCFFISVRA